MAWITETSEKNSGLQVQSYDVGFRRIAWPHKKKGAVGFGLI